MSELLSHLELSEINVFPIKSLHGISVERSIVEPQGLQFDRRLMLVDDDGRFISQREVAAMARIIVAVNSKGLTASLDEKSIDISFASNDGENVDVTIWDDTVRANIYEANINEWFSQAIGKSCRLVSKAKDETRNVDAKYAVNGLENEVGFADGYPYLLIGQASLDELNSRLDEPIPMARFRPNLVVSGSEPFAEDNWKKIRVGEAIFHLVKPCARCVITTIDQEEGVRTGPEPLRTLAKFRNRDGKVLFGENLIAENPVVEINLGDKVEVLEYR